MTRFMKFFEAGFTMAIGMFLCVAALLDVYDVILIKPAFVASMGGLGIMYAGSAAFKLVRTVEKLEGKKKK